jgi:hypothetical protein
MRARSFFFVCLGILCLAITYHLGAQSAKAQVVSGNPVVATWGGVVYTANGDAYFSPDATTGTPYHWVNNVFGGGAPTTVERITLGDLKAKYR